MLCWQNAVGQHIYLTWSCAEHQRFKSKVPAHCVGWLSPTVYRCELCNQA